MDKPLQDEIVTDSGLRLFLDPSYSKEWHSTVVAKISALPIKVDSKHKHIFDQIKVGDTVAFSYLVVADFIFESDAPNFMAVTDNNPYYKQYVNGKGEWLSVYAIKGLIAPIWIGLYEGKRRNLIDGVQGSEHDLERWLAQFPLGKTDVYRFNNLFNFNGQDYWKCDLTEIFAKKVNGRWVSVGNRVICKPIDEKMPEQFVLPEYRGEDVMVRRQDRARVMSGGKSKGIKKDDVVSFNPTFLEKYTMENKEYYLVNDNYVQGKWVKDGK